MTLKAKVTYHFLKVRKKPWYIWLLRLVWLTWIIFWVEVAWGSWKELEPRAAVISPGILVFSLVAAILLWFWGGRRRNNSTLRRKTVSAPNEN
jgi:hypothetical protein